MTILKERITITVDAEVLAHVKEAAGESSVSSVVEQALREMLDRRRNARAHLRRRVAEIEQRDPERAALAREQAKELVETIFKDTR